MGNKVSKPARKLAGNISKTNVITGNSSQRVQLPSQELKDRFNNSNSEPQASPQSNEEAWQSKVNATKQQTEINPQKQNPEGKDGMDPQADPDFIKLINSLGRQIHSHSEQKSGEQLNVRALKQLLNRRKLYEKGQDEVKKQLDAVELSRSMIHPRTLTGIIYALNDPRVKKEDILKDYQIDKSFLENMGRFKVAENVVIIEETTKPDEIGPKLGQPVSRASRDPSLMDENGTISETVNEDRIRVLKSRLE